MIETQDVPARIAFSVLLLVIAAAVCGTAQQPKPKIVEASRFVLVDANGKPRGALTMSEFGPSIVLNDQSGKTRIQLTVRDGSGPELAIFDQAGDRRSVLSLNPDQSPTLLMLDADEKPRAMLGSEGIILK